MCDLHTKRDNSTCAQERNYVLEKLLAQIEYYDTH